jgi:hypothetical protein
MKIPLRGYKRCVKRLFVLKRKLKRMRKEQKIKVILIDVKIKLKEIIEKQLTLLKSQVTTDIKNGFLKKIAQSTFEAIDDLLSIKTHNIVEAQENVNELLQYFVKSLEITVNNFDESYSEFKK